MHCKNCGAALAPDAEFCTTCGTPVEKAAPAAPVAPAVNPVEAAKEKLSSFIPANIPTPKKKGGLGNTLGVIFGILAMIGGLIIIFGASTSLSYASFGGDFYTYAYRGIRAIEEVLVVICQGIGGLLSAFGAFMTFYFSNAKKQ
jgi:hypothetical protein